MISALSGTVKLNGVALPVSDVEVTVDEAAAPFASGSFTVPYTADLAAALDPRASKPPRVQITLRQDFFEAQAIASFNTESVGLTAADFNRKYAGWSINDFNLNHATVWNAFGVREAVSRTLDLGVRSRRIQHSGATIAVEVASDEALLQDGGLVASTGVSPAGLTVLSAITLVLTTTFGAGGYDLHFGSEGGQAITADSAVWQPGVGGWDYLQPLTASAGVRLWCDEKRVWHLSKPETITNPGQVRLFATNTIKDAEDTVSRNSDAWYEAVVVKYDWTDTGNVRHVEYDVAGNPGSGRVLLVQRDTPKPRAGEAAARLRKLSGQGRVLNVDAVADFAAYPATDLQLTLPDSPVQAGWISAVTWRIGADDMTVRTRELVDTPANAWTLVAPGKAWNAVPAGTAWTGMVV